MEIKDLQKVARSLKLAKERGKHSSASCRNDINFTQDDVINKSPYADICIWAFAYNLLLSFKTPHVPLTKAHLPVPYPYYRQDSVKTGNRE